MLPKVFVEQDLFILHNGARVNKISTSGSGGDVAVLARAFLDSNSLFMFVSKNSFIL